RLQDLARWISLKWEESFVRSRSTLVRAGIVIVSLLVGCENESSNANGMNAASAAKGCTLYASPTGKDSSSGSRPNAPKTFEGAANAAQPGDVVCIMGGTYNRTGSFYPPRGGMPNAWIIYKAYGDSPVNFVYTG